LCGVWGGGRRQRDIESEESVRCWCILSGCRPTLLLSVRKGGGGAICCL